MVTRRDWLTKPLPELNVMFTNVHGKIGDYKTAYGLTTVWVDRVLLICDSFTTAYMGIAVNRATAKDLNNWFNALLNGAPKGSPAPPAPVFDVITLPTGAFVGLLDEFREMMRFFKANAAYTDADGENLMIVSASETGGDINEAVPELKISIDVNNVVAVEYTKKEFSGLELQWRKVGETLWQMADKSTEKVITFTPPNITSPQKIELRGVYLLKNNRVGQWSPMYTLTV